MTDEAELLTNPYAVASAMDQGEQPMAPDSHGEIVLEYELNEEDLDAARRDWSVKPTPKPASNWLGWLLLSAVAAGMLMITHDTSLFAAVAGFASMLGLAAIRVSVPAVKNSAAGKYVFPAGMAIVSLGMALAYPLNSHASILVWMAVAIVWLILIASHTTSASPPAKVVRTFPGLEQWVMLGPRCIVVSPQGVTMTTPIGRFEYRWAGFERIEYVADRVFLLHSHRMGIVVPLRTLNAADQAMVVALVKKYHNEATQAGVQPMPEVGVPAAMNEDKSSRPAMISKN